MTQILIVEDEAKIAELLQKYLHNANYQTECLSNGNDVLPWLSKHQPDLILLDWMLPGKDGIELCKTIRQTSNVPIIMLTARVEEIDKLLGLELGADDYICKPFSPREVVARIKSVLRRSQAPSTHKVTTGLLLKPQELMATFDDREIELTLVEFNLLSMLHQQPGRVFTREQLMTRIYQDHRIVSERTIDSHVKKLRKKIEQLVPEAELIHAVYGVGYKYEPINLTHHEH